MLPIEIPFARGKSWSSPRFPCAISPKLRPGRRTTHPGECQANQHYQSNNPTILQKALDKTFPVHAKTPARTAHHRAERLDPREKPFEVIGRERSDFWREGTSNLTGACATGEREKGGGTQHILVRPIDHRLHRRPTQVRDRVGTRDFLHGQGPGRKTPRRAKASAVRILCTGHRPVIE
jgi:hypothetical protein